MRCHLPNPDQRARSCLTSLEPWQLDSVEELRERGIDGDAVIRAGVTLMLASIATATDVKTEDRVGR